MRKLVGVIALMGTACGGAYSATPPAPVSSSPQPRAEPVSPNLPGAAEIVLCGDSDAPPIVIEWRKAIGAALTRFSFVAYKQPPTTYSVRAALRSECAGKLHGACYGGAGTVYCDADALAGVFQAAAWMSAGVTVAFTAHQEKYDKSKGLPFVYAIRAQNALEIVDALAAHRSDRLDEAVGRIIGNGTLAANDFTSFILPAINRLHQFDVDPRMAPEDLGVDALLAYSVYEATSNYLTAFLFGHELAHAQHTCAVSEPSMVERNQVLSTLIDTQAGGRVLCPNALNMAEVNADTCALRAVDRIDHMMVEYKTKKGDPTNLLSEGRRFALDLFGWILALGLGSSTETTSHWIPAREGDLPTLAMTMEWRQGYMYSALRLAVLASLLNALEPSNKALVRICEDNAQRFVLSLNYAAGICLPPSNAPAQEIDQSQFPSKFGQFVPSGVVRGWQTHVWDDREFASFRCDAP